VIERDGSVVTVSLHLAGEYEAMQTYDTLIEQAREGCVLLDVETVIKEPMRDDSGGRR